MKIRLKTMLCYQIPRAHAFWKTCQTVSTLVAFLGDFRIIKQRAFLSVDSLRLLHKNRRPEPAQKRVNGQYTAEGAQQNASCSSSSLKTQEKAKQIKPRAVEIRLRAGPNWSLVRQSGQNPAKERTVVRPGISTT